MVKGVGREAQSVELHVVGYVDESARVFEQMPHGDRAKPRVRTRPGRRREVVQYVECLRVEMRVAALDQP